MAIYRPGVLAGGISGAVGGVVFANTRGSSVVRHRPATLHKSLRSPATDTSSPAAALQAAIAGWHSLVDISRLAWVAAAANVTFPNRLGQLRNISGYQLYLKVNVLRAYTGLTVLVTGPGVSRPSPVTSLTVTASVAAGLDIAVDREAPAGNAFALLYGSVHWSGTVHAFFRDFRYLDTPTFVLATPQDLTASWTPVFGPLRLGQHIAIRVTPWNIFSWPTTPFTVATTVVA